VQHQVVLATNKYAWPMAIAVGLDPAYRQVMSDISHCCKNQESMQQQIDGGIISEPPVLTEIIIMNIWD
jgi:hypothetical protein